jgi:hypothetical protein
LEDPTTLRKFLLRANVLPAEWIALEKVQSLVFRETALPAKRMALEEA